MLYKRFFLFLIVLFSVNNILSSELVDKYRQTAACMHAIGILQSTDEVFKHITWDQLNDLMFEHMRHDQENINEWMSRLQEAARMKLMISPEIDAEINYNDKWFRLRSLAIENPRIMDESTTNWYNRLIDLNNGQIQIIKVVENKQLRALEEFEDGLSQIDPEEEATISGNFKDKIKVACKIGLPLTALAIGIWLYNKKAKKIAAQEANS